MTKAASFDYSQAVGSWPTSHDGVGNVLRCAEDHTHSGMTDRVIVNTYDHCNRLDTETITPSGGSTVTTDYGYDLADNRTSKAVGSTVTEYHFGNGNNGANPNQLKSYGPSGQTATHTFTYDNNGNRLTKTTSAGTEDYTWDEENRLTLLETPSGDYAYQYDHRTRRIVRDESAASGALTELTFSGGTSVQEANSSGTVQVELIRGSDWGGGVGGVLFTIRGGNRSYNAYNSRGDVVSISDDNGDTDWQAAYEAFGTRTQENGTNTERQRANTKDEDPTGLLNEGFRYRDLEAGVFISRDPLGFVDGPNVYTYVRQNPWSAYDPDGLFLKWLENAGGRHYENKAMGLGNNWGHSLFGPIPQAVRDVSDFDEHFKLADRTGGAAKVVGGGLEITVAAMAAPVTGGGSMVGAFHGADLMTSGWSDVWSGESSRTVTHQVIGGYSMMAGADYETADKIGGLGDAAVSLGSGGFNSASIVRAEANTMNSARVVAAENAVASETPGINIQKQAGHVPGTPQYANRVKFEKPTSTFFDAKQADAVTTEAWLKGKPLGSDGKMRLFDFGKPIGVGPKGGGYQTQVRASLDKGNQIHGSPWGPVYEGPLQTPPQ